MFMDGIILFYLMATIWHGGDYLNLLLCESLLAMIAGLAAVYARHNAGHGRDFLTSVTRYPCCSGRQIYNFSQKAGYDYLLYIDKDKLKVINNFGSSQQVCPALQPRPR